MIFANHTITTGAANARGTISTRTAASTIAWVVVAVANR